MKWRAKAFALLEVLVASVIAAMAFILALAALDYNQRQAQVQNLYSSVLQTSNGFHELLILNARKGGGNNPVNVSMNGASNANCVGFNQVYQGAIAAALCRSVVRQMDPSQTGSVQGLRVTFSNQTLFGQSARLATTTSGMPTGNLSNTTRLVIPWGD